jgi:hypothetical protein
MDKTAASKALSSPAAVPLAGAALLLGLFVYYDFVVYRNYLLRGDEPAFIGATLESPASWFTRGYTDYFNVYPEWVLGTTQLLKPVTNLVGYLNYTLFGSTYALHFAVYVAFQFLGLLFFVRILRELAIPPLPAAGMSLLFLFNPAFMNAGFVCLPCHADVLAGVFALAAFFTAWRSRYGVALALLVFAVFTKESAVYAPLAAALSMLVWRRPPIISALMVLPLPLWALARFLAYGALFDTGIGRPYGQIAEGLSIWPTGIVSVGFLSGWASSFPSNRAEIVSAVFFAANIGLWIFLCYAAWTAARRQIDEPARAEFATGLLIWTLGALSFGVLAGFHPRYGGSIYPFLYLVLAALFFSPDYRVPRWVVASVLLVFSAATFVQSARNVRLGLAWQSIIAPDRALHDALRALPQDSRTVYIVNAPAVQLSAPQYLSRAWSLNLNLVIVNQFGGCLTSADAGSTHYLESSNLLSVRLPECATFSFGPATPHVQTTSRGAMLRRERVGTYEFPDATSRRETDTASLGRGMTVRLESENTRPTMIAYDWSSGSYSVLLNEPTVPRP